MNDIAEQLPEAAFPASQRSNLLDELLSELRRHADDNGLLHNTTFAQKALEWLGLVDQDEGVRIDGANDRGVDFYSFSSDSLTIVQSKSQDFVAKGPEVDTSVGPEYLSDIPRIVSLLRNADEPQKNASRPVKNFLKKLQATIRAMKLAETEQTSEKPPVFSISLNLALLARDLTPAARSELINYRRDFELLTICGLMSSARSRSIRWTTSWRPDGGWTTSSGVMRAANRMTRFFFKPKKA